MQKQQNSFQIAVGFVVLIVSALFVGQIYKVRTIGNSAFGLNLILNAKFSNIDGIYTGSDVKMSGVKIGIVTDVILDESDYMASVSISVSNSIKIPNDSILAVSTSGLLGTKFLDIKPGFSDNYMKTDDRFLSTTSSVNLENLISKFASNIGNDNKK